MDSTLGLAYEEVPIPSELGPLPAWFVPGQRPTRALPVHSFHATREEGLRILSHLSQMGFPIATTLARH